MKKSNIYFLIALVCALVADTATYARVWWVAVIMYAVFAYCMVRLIIDNNRHEDHMVEQYEKTRRAMSKLYRCIEDKQLMTAEEIANATEDKPTGTVRPGSKPSIRFLEMSVDKEEPYDAGREDQEPA